MLHVLLKIAVSLFANYYHDSASLPIMIYLSLPQYKSNVNLLESKVIVLLLKYKLNNWR